MTNQATAFRTQSYYPPQSQEDYTAQSAPQATWETYYNYAKQLYDNGYTAQAEAYYRQAKLLYEQAEKRQAESRRKTQSVQSYGAYSSPNAARNRPITAEVQSIYAVSPTVLVDEDSFLNTKQRRSFAKLLKVWTVSMLTTGLIVSIGGFLGLFYYYNHQLRQAAEPPSAAPATWGGIASEWVQGVTLRPMTKVLKPAFDKIIRVSRAAQPLMYELKLRSAPPDTVSSVDAKQPSNEEGIAAMLPSNLAPKIDDTVVATGALSNDEETSQKVEVGQAPGEAAAAAGQASSENGDAAASSLAKPASDEDRSAEASGAETESNDRSRSERSRKRRSNRSSSQPGGEWASGNVQEIPSADDSFQNSGASFNAAASTAKAPAFEPPPVNPNSKTRELDDLLTPKAKAAPRAGNNSFDASAPFVKQTLSRSEVQQGMSQVASNVKLCGQGSMGTVTVSVKIESNGRISSAVAVGEFAATAIGSCAERAVKQAVFPSSAQSLTVKYPFTL